MFFRGTTGVHRFIKLYHVRKKIVDRYTYGATLKYTLLPYLFLTQLNTLATLKLFFTINTFLKKVRIKRYYRFKLRCRTVSRWAVVCL